MFQPSSAVWRGDQATCKAEFLSAIGEWSWSSGFHWWPRW